MKYVKIIYNNEFILSTMRASYVKKLSRYRLLKVVRLELENSIIKGFKMPKLNNFCFLVELYSTILWFCKQLLSHNRLYNDNGFFAQSL